METTITYDWEPDDPNGYHATFYVEGTAHPPDPGGRWEPPDDAYATIDNVDLDTITAAFRDGEYVDIPTLTIELRTQLVNAFQDAIDTNPELEERLKEMILDHANEVSIAAMDREHDDVDYDYDLYS